MNKTSLVCLTSMLVVISTTASARPTPQKFRLKVIAHDAKTHKPRSTFALGESVLVRVSLTNQSRNAQTINQLDDSWLPYRLTSQIAFENGPDIHEGYIGMGGLELRETALGVAWLERPPRTITLAPGKTVSSTIDIGDHYHGYPLQEGSYSVTVKYNSSLRATTSFRIVIDERKSKRLLEELAEMPVPKNGSDTVQSWARISLDWIRHPWITGRIVDTEGRPLKHVRLVVTGTKQFEMEPPEDGIYRLFLDKGGTYTITPEIPAYHYPGKEEYTIAPASRTFTNLNGNVTDVNFTATRIRASTNVAFFEEGSTTKASSFEDFSEADNVVDGFPNEGWSDGTPNVFPDWIEVDFGRTRRINWINVFGPQDDPKNTPDPDLIEKFSKDGVTDFDVQYLTDRGWRTVPGGAIRNNRNVMRMISFPEIATNKIRVVVRNGLGGRSRITEIEAYHLNDLPQGKIIAKANAHTNAPVQFRTEMFDRDGTIRNYELDFGDDSDDYEWNFDDRKSDKPQFIHSHVYEREGTYKVTLRLVDDSNEASETSILVTIVDPPKRNESQ